MQTISTPKKPPIPPQFLLYLSQLLSCGVPLVKALDLIAFKDSSKTLKNKTLKNNNSKNINFKNILRLKQDLRAGIALSTTLEKHFAINACYLNLLIIGENAGNIETILATIANYEAKFLSLKNKIFKAIIYPAIILVVAVISLVFIVTVVIPEFVNLYQGFNLELPVFTQAIIFGSNFVGNFWWPFIIGCSILWLCFWVTYRRQAKLYAFIHHKILMLPFFGNLSQKFILSRAMAALGWCLQAGVPITKSLELIVGITSNNDYKLAFAKLESELYLGVALSKAIINYNQDVGKIFPNLLIEMLMVSEETGQLESMLHHIANLFAAEVNNTIERLVALLEPALILVFGVIVGAIVVAMYLPLLNIGELL